MKPATEEKNESTDTDIYDPAFIGGLFDSMAKSYGYTNLIASFGFSQIWRRQCVYALGRLPPNALGYDLMTGMGEAWVYLLRLMAPGSRLIALDLSREMLRRAEKHKRHFPDANIEIDRVDVLAEDFAPGQADFVNSTFGVKTFNREQCRRLAVQIVRLLKPGGKFSLLEISEPSGQLLKRPYMFYLQRLIPTIGKLCLGNPENYRMLGRYTQSFSNCRELEGFLRDEGLVVDYRQYFFGCATGVVGYKPE